MRYSNRYLKLSLLKLSLLKLSLLCGYNSRFDFCSPFFQLNWGIPTGTWNCHNWNGHYWTCHCWNCHCLKLSLTSDEPKKYQKWPMPMIFVKLFCGGFGILMCQNYMEGFWVKLLSCEQFWVKTGFVDVCGAIIPDIMCYSSFWSPCICSYVILADTKWKLK